MLTIDHQTITTFATEAKAAALAAQLLADDPETDYQVVKNEAGFYVAIFEGGTQVYTL